MSWSLPLAVHYEERFLELPRLSILAYAICQTSIRALEPIGVTSDSCLGLELYAQECATLNLISDQYRV
jgi:hypothetical protein